MKSVKGLDILKSIVSSLPANMSGSGWESGTSPKSLVAFAGPHSPEAQSGNGTITVDKLGQSILTCTKRFRFKSEFQNIISLDTNISICEFHCVF